MPASALDLSLAAVRLRVVAHRAEQRAAQARYERFVDSPARDAVEIHTAFDASLKRPLSPTPWPGASCERHKDTLLFTRRDDRLTWDVAKGQARFVVAKPVPVDALPATVPPFVETALRMVLATELIRAGGLLVHACGWANDEHSVLFAGFSGAGKTTTAAKLPDNEVLSDDQVALRDGDAWSLPFVGQWNRPTSARRAPLKAIALLGQSTSPALHRLTGAQALARLLGCVVSFDPAQTQQAFALAARLVETVPVYQLDLERETPMHPWIERMCI